MPKIGTSPALSPRWTPVARLRPGTEFVCPPGGSLAGGVFLGLCGDDAKVAAHEHSGRERREYWSAAALVLPGNILPADQVQRLSEAARPATAESIQRRDERRANVLTRKEQKAIVAKINLRPPAAPSAPARRPTPVDVGDDL